MRIRVIFIFALCCQSALADPPTIDAVVVDGSRVSVTISHPDTGWDHYADGWRIEDADGQMIGTRELLHPHVEEQPFTRSLNVPSLPNGPLFVRAKCSVDGWSDTRVEVVR